jgi:hypothetical protein
LYQTNELIIAINIHELQTCCFKVINSIVSTFPRCQILQCIQKVTVHLQKVLEVMSTSVYTGLNLFNFIRKHFLQICLWDASYECSYCSF